MIRQLEDEFGDIVQKARQGHGLSVAELSERTGLSPQRLKELESYAPPAPEEIAPLAAALGLHAEKLRQIAEGLWQPQEQALAAGPQYPVERVTYEPWRVHCYVVGQPNEKQCLVIDPGAEAAALQELLQRYQWRVSGILVTHGHPDHVGAVGPLQRVTGSPVYVHAADAAALKEVPASALRLVEDLEELELGPFVVRALHIPGHTAGSLAYLLGAAVFTGDILFAGSIGRANLGPSSYREFLDGISQKLLELPGDTRVFPGHGPATTVAAERAHNPFFGFGAENNGD